MKKVVYVCINGLLVLAISSSVFAGDAARFAYEKCVVESVLDRKCLQDKYKEVKEELRLVYADIIKDLKRDKEHAYETSETYTVRELEWYKKRPLLLERSQTLWEETKQVTCKAATTEFRGGSLAWPSEMQCLFRMTWDRLEQLKSIYTNILEP